MVRASPLAGLAWVSTTVDSTPAAAQETLMLATRASSPSFAENDTVTVASPLPEAGDTVNAALSQVIVQSALEEMLKLADMASAFALSVAGLTLQNLTFGSASAISVATTLMNLLLPVRPVK